MAKNLVIYYSRKGNNYVNGGIRNLKKGNTEIVAEYIADAVGADLFEVETVRTYNEDYMVCIEEAKEDMPKECNVISFGHNDEKVQVTNSATRGIVPEEVAIGTIKVETGDNQR